MIQIQLFAAVAVHLADDGEQDDGYHRHTDQSPREDQVEEGIM